MKQLELVTVGSDPELFLTEDGHPFPVIGMLGGSKQHPKPVQYGAVQEDNVLAEFNIDPVSIMDEEAWVRNHLSVMNTLQNMLPAFELKAVPSMDFPKEILKANPKAMAAGCSADYNAYTGKANPRPDMRTTLRTAGGHVHVGHPLLIDDEDLQRELIKKLDQILGIPSRKYDTDERRRTMYGDLGAYRSKSYGVEYRVLSNFWVSRTKYMRWVFRGIRKAWKEL